MALIVHDVALEMIRLIKPLIDRIARHDRALANQLKRSASSVVLNIGEGSRSRGGNEIARFQDAAGSASETRSALRVAEAWGYIRDSERIPVDAKLDRVCAMLWGLTHRGARNKQPLAV
jgi:four helix bundle protein